MHYTKSDELLFPNSREKCKVSQPKESGMLSNSLWLRRGYTTYAISEKVSEHNTVHAEPTLCSNCYWE